MQRLAASVASIATAEPGSLPFVGSAGNGWPLVLSLLVGLALLAGGIGFVLTAGDEER